MQRCTLRFFFQPADRASHARDYLSKMTLDVGTVHRVDLEEQDHGTSATVHLELPNAHGPSPRDIRRLVTAARNFNGIVDVGSSALNAPGRRIVRIAFARVENALSALSLLGGAALQNDLVTGASVSVGLPGNAIVTMGLFRKDGLDATGMHPRDLGKILKVAALLNGSIDEIRRCEVPRD